MLYKINAKRLINKSTHINKGNLIQIEKRITDTLTAKGSCHVVVTGAPGCGKSTLARTIKQKGLLKIPKEQLFIIDDLRGSGRKKYKRKELPILVEALKDQVLLLFDYKAALYLKKADFGVILVIDEKERLNNLRKRSAWGFKKYKNRFYGTPPIPFTFRKRNIYVCSGDVLDTFGHEK